MSSGPDQSGEFGFIKQLAEIASKTPESLGLADDGAVITLGGQQLVVVKDLVQAGIHALSDDSVIDVVRKAIRVNLSDLAAMGSVPKFVLLGICFGDAFQFGDIPDLAKQIWAECDLLNVALIGGDTVRGKGPLTVSVTAIGEVAGAPIRRNGAKVGDDIWVSGTIGDAALGLRTLQAYPENTGLQELNPEQTQWLQDRYRLPQPRNQLGVALRGIANSMIDISDGLAADTGHIAGASEVRMNLEYERIPLSSAFRKWSKALNNKEKIWRTLSAGDDYELLFSAPPTKRNQVELAAIHANGTVTRIGQVEAGSGVGILIAGQPSDLSLGGFTHF